MSIRFTRTERRIFFELQTGVLLRKECGVISVEQAETVGRRMGEEMVASKGFPAVYHVRLKDGTVEVERIPTEMALPTKHVVWDWPLSETTDDFGRTSDGGGSDGLPE